MATSYLVITQLASAGKSYETFSSYEDMTSTFIFDDGPGATIETKS